MVEAAIQVDRLFYPPDSAMPISDTMAVLDALHAAVGALDRVRSVSESQLIVNEPEAVYG